MSNKDEKLVLRLPFLEKEMWRAQAASEGLSLSAWVRELADRELAAANGLDTEERRLRGRVRELENALDREYKWRARIKDQFLA